MTFLLSLRQPFVADHFHEEPYFVEARHGHNWLVEATIQATSEDQASPFARSLNAWVEDLDYTLLNDQPRLEGRNPTTELLAQWACEHLAQDGLQVESVKVREKANYWALCRPR